MGNPIAPRVMPVVRKLFPNNPEQGEGIGLLQSECGRNLPGCDKESPMTPLQRRIRFAAFKVSGGDVDKFHKAIALAKPDWRDLLVEAGFANNVDSADEWSRQIQSG